EVAEAAELADQFAALVLALLQDRRIALVFRTNTQGLTEVLNRVSCLGPSAGGPAKQHQGNTPTRPNVPGTPDLPHRTPSLSPDRRRPPRPTPWDLHIPAGNGGYGLLSVRRPSEAKPILPSSPGIAVP